ncbi:MAG: molybdopterin-dependent oxidoreductase [Gemmatimonadales bacterium]|nr:molybdopterin-dependent oxidoreductase [Gemmatimonadales bacterium]NIN12259.1 molybdopterin-dependent oxidoreductase [Gemmatimonadales bacterium]NIN50661.1 molybdopterin-dependent oxidoreductase [Gemmatimonadales bacterium]NIP08125.1 molybdopterin-dependent oxidoreductase [Gemmatimonadales bacterium]NIR03418.1 molybdopterin-dependent oxidoreductase [Gemmatimonadales bacterium]
MTPTQSDAKLHTMILDGEEVPFTEGETVYEVAARRGKEIPTLCYDERLEPFGGCRLCVVEVEGVGLPAASCTTKGAPGMVVRTSTAAIERHRKVLLELVASENRELDVDPLRGYASQELTTLVDRYRARAARFAGKQSGRSRLDDDNPFILRDYDLCISCYRCVRVCAEQEGDYAISVKGRGFGTQITTDFDGLLRDSTCTFCGQCVQTCPTGALADRKALRYAELPGEIETTRTICAYCGVGCSVDVLTKGDRMVGIHPAMDGPANTGALCVKGQFAFDFVQHPDRLTMPLVRGSDDELHETDWDAALDRAAEGFRKALQDHGRHSIYGVASGRAPSEAAYTMQKLMRAGFGTNQIDNCSRA